MTMDKKLSLKQKLTILSRKDRMGKAVPTPLRLVVMITVLTVLIITLNYLEKESIDYSDTVATPKSEEEIQISFVGDVNVGRYVESYSRYRSINSLLGQASIIWSNSDLVMANLETVILDNEDDYVPTDKEVHISGSPDSLQALVDSGVNVLSIANNHTIDYGQGGIECELRILNQMDVNYAGAGSNMEEATSSSILECGDLSVAFVAFDITVSALTTNSYTTAINSYPYLYQNVHDASLEADIVVVYVHWGRENSQMISDEQERIAHQLIESGADIVVGSHPHVLQPVERYQDGVIFYSLGNFLFDQGSSPSRNTAMVQLNLNQGNGCGEFVIIPMRINSFAPEIIDSGLHVWNIQNVITRSLSSDDYYVTEDNRIHIPVDFHLIGEGDA